ncbi:MAG: ribosome maturation factor RimM [Pseudomonadota bacterium]
MGSPKEPDGDAKPLLVGEIGAAQGLKGEVRLRSYTQEPTDIAAYGPLRNEAGTKTIEIDRVRVTPKALIARIKGVATREAAEALNRTKLYISREALPQPTDDEWYVADMIGLKAVSPDGAPLGTVAAVHNFGASDIIEIAPDEGPSYLVAFTDDTVPEVTISKGQLVLIPPEEIDAKEDDEDGSA